MVLSKRARSQDQKEERRGQIVKAAADLFQRQSYDAITMEAVARKAGMAKGTVFIYFPTKEALFFQLTADAFVDWFDDMERVFGNLAQGTGQLGVAQALEHLTGVLQQRRTLGRLIAINHIIFERNIGFEQALAFKRMTARRLKIIGKLMEKSLGFLRPGQGVKLLLWMYALVIGFIHLAEPAPVIAKVYQRDPEVGKLKIEFGQEYFQALGSILTGWQTQNQSVRSAGSSRRRS